MPQRRLTQCGPGPQRSKAADFGFGFCFFPLWVLDSETLQQLGLFSSFLGRSDCVVGLCELFGDTVFARICVGETKWLWGFVLSPSFPFLLRWFLRKCSILWVHAGLMKPPPV